MSPLCPMWYWWDSTWRLANQLQEGSFQWPAMVWGPASSPQADLASLQYGSGVFRVGILKDFYNPEVILVTSAIFYQGS